MTNNTLSDNDVHPLTKLLIDSGYLTVSEVKLISLFDNWFDVSLKTYQYQIGELKIYINFFLKNLKKLRTPIKNKFGFFYKSIKNSKTTIGHKFEFNQVRFGKKPDKLKRHAWLDDVIKELSDDDENLLAN